MEDAYAFGSARAVRRWVRVAVTWRPVAWLSARALPGLDRITYSLTGGRRILSAALTGLPVVELITTGARSGKARSTWVLGIPAEGALVVIAANFGEPSHPAWYHNLVAHPRVQVVIDGREVDCAARVLQGTEADAGFERALRLNPGWRRFRERAGGRSIPVVELTALPA